MAHYPEEPDIDKRYLRIATEHLIPVDTGGPKTVYVSVVSQFCVQSMTLDAKATLEFFPRELDVTREPGQRLSKEQATELVMTLSR